jgi:hypothetical protein
MKANHSPNLKQPPQIKRGNTFWSEIISGHAAKRWPARPKVLLHEIQPYRTFMLNPLSHSTITAAYKSEIQKSMAAVNALELGLAAIKWCR